MSRTGRGSDRGAAAVELALVLTALLGILSLVVPLALMLHTQLLLGNAAGDAVRFATSRTDQPRSIAGTAVRANDLPTAAQVRSEAQIAYSGSRFRRFLPATVGVTTSEARAVSDLTCPSTWRRSVAVTASIDLGPLYRFVTRSTGTTKTLRASATSCEE